MPQVLDPLFVSVANGRSYAANQVIARNSGNTAYAFRTSFFNDADITFAAAGSGAGTNRKIKGSSAGSGNSNGGDLTLEAGTKSGSGADGRVVVIPAGGTIGSDGILIYQDLNGASSTKRAVIEAPITNLAATVTANKNAGWVLNMGDGTSFFQCWYTDGGFTKRTTVNCNQSAFNLLSNGSFGFVNSTVTAQGNSDTNINRPSAGVVGFSGSSTGGTIRSAPISPTSLSADQNDYNPGVGMFYRLTSSLAVNITGMSISQVDGQVCEIWNVGSNNIVLKHQSASSTAANRFICTGGADITLAADEVALLRYDSTTSRWRVRKV